MCLFTLCVLSVELLSVFVQNKIDSLEDKLAEAVYSASAGGVYLKTGKAP